MNKNLTITSVDMDTQEQARKIILGGLEERFGFLDSSFNTDLNHIVLNYVEAGHIFLVGMIGLQVVCTGVLWVESKEIGRICRMSVVKESRRQGYAQLILQELEMIAASRGIQKLVLETNVTWDNAINFYKLSGYRKDYTDETRIHMFKKVESND